MILIADCGSTKIDWCALKNGKLEKQIFTMGMNCRHALRGRIRERLAADSFPSSAFSRSKYLPCFFYGADVSPRR